jgi:hypothetical protein
MSFVETVADLWTFEADWRVVFTNGIVHPKTGRLVMGAGNALQAKQRHKDVDLILGRLVRLHGNKVFILRALHLISLPTKEHFKNPSTLERVEQSLRELHRLFDCPERRQHTVVMGWPGCGLGGLRREDVRPLLGRFLDERFTLVSPPEE